MLAIYGSSYLVREECPWCKAYAFVIDGKFTCCDMPGQKTTQDKKVFSQARNKKKKPSQIKQRELAETQENRCFYCKRLIGDFYIYRGKTRQLKRHWDHLLPYCFARDNQDTNFVLACNICNSIKSDLVFKTLEDSSEYIDIIRKKKGYIFSEKIPPPQPSQMSYMPQAFRPLEKHCPVLLKNMPVESLGQKTSPDAKTGIENTQYIQREDVRKPRKCGYCKKTFPAKSGQKFCTTTCRWKQWETDHPRRGGKYDRDS